MIQRTFDVTNESELVWMLNRLHSYLEYTNIKSIFVQFYLSRFSGTDAMKVANLVKSELENAKVVGMSLYGDPFVGLNAEKLMRFNFCLFEESDIEVLEYDSEKLSLEEITADFRSHLKATKNLSGVLLLESGLTFKASDFMEKATEGFEEIPFFGSIANINTADTNDQDPYAFGKTLVKHGVVATIFSGKNLHFYTESVFGWKPIGKNMVVKAGKSGAVGDSLISEIDGIPATQIYKKYLNVDPDRHFISNICEFPLVVKRNGYNMARVPCGYNDRGELNSMGDVKDGETVRFTYGKTEEILNQTREASFRMRDFAPQAIFLYVCANRAIFLKERAHEEIDLYGSIVGDTVYCHGFSELYKFKGQGGVFNSQLVTVGLREGEIDTQSGARCLLLGVDFGDGKKSMHFAGKAGDEIKQNDDIARAIGCSSVKEIAEGKPATLSPSSNANTTESESENNRRQWAASHDKAAFNAGGVSSMERLTSGKNDEHSMFQESLGKSIPMSERLVTFLEATTDELKKATEAANAANEAKSAFLSNMSHEIRTPINAVLGLDEMILREASEENIKNYARDIQSSGRALLTIINDILDFSKIEAGKMEIIPADYDLRQLLNDLTNMVASRAINKGLEFVVDIDPTIPHLLHGDNVRVQQCALNILTNAVKYTRRGRVMLSVGAEKTATEEIELCFAIHDTGIGIKAEDLPRLYSPFERIEESRNRSIEGTGLGMSIVNGLLKQMDARLEVNSIYGEGSTFSFAVKQKVRDWEKIGTYEEALSALKSEATSYTESFQAPNAHILVVDDTPMNLTVIRGLLKTTRINIDTASSAEEGLKLIRQNHYDILFIDHLMPKMDGIEMLKIIRAGEDNHSHTPCIALTANAISGAREKYLQAGFDAYLSKPVDSKKLEATIIEYLSANLVLKKGDTGFLESEQKKWDGVERRAHCCGEAGAIIRDVFALDIESALQNCGSRDVFMQASWDFADAIEENARLIEKFAAENDWKNYTVKVHALKSSARLIGANELSALAKSLEEAGNKAQGEIITEKTPELLKEYRSYLPKLAVLTGNPTLASGLRALSESAGEKSAMSAADFADAINAIKEAARAFDFDTADSIAAEVDKYSLDESQARLWNEMRAAIRAVDAGKIASLE